MEKAVPIGEAAGIEDQITNLRHLLEEQLTAGREANFSRMLQLGEQADAVVAGIVKEGGGEPAVTEARRHDLERLYNGLAQMLRAERANMQGKLKQLRRVKRAVNAYRTDR